MTNLTKKLKTVCVTLVVVGSFSASSSARSSTEPSRWMAQKSAEERIERIVRSLDQDAVAYVDISSKMATKTKLPATPFTVKEINIDGLKGQDSFEALSVTILTKNKSLPPSVIQVIKSSLANYGRLVVVKVQTMPKEMLVELKKRAAHEAKKEAALEGQSKKAPSDKIVTEGERRLESAILEIKGAITKFALAAEEGIAKLLDRRLIIAFAVLGGVFLVIYFLAIFLLTFMASRRSRKMERGLVEGLKAAANEIKLAMDEGGFSGIADQKNGKADTSPHSESHLPAVGVGGSLRENSLASLPATSIEALLSDCYWSGLDGYALYLWKNIPLSSRSELIKKIPFLRRYADYLSAGKNIRELNLGMENDPYYLSPLAMTSLDNEVLTARIRETPALYHFIPSLRSDSMKLSATDRLLFSKEINDDQAKKIGLESLEGWIKAQPPSPTRDLKVIRLIPIASVSEEEEILETAELSMDNKEALQSLAWLAELELKDREVILKEFSAKALASAWLGPQAVLARLAETLPKDKVDLLNSYLEKISPSRSSAVFVSLHQKTLARLRELEKESDLVD